MNLFQSLSLAAWAWKHSFRQAGRGSLWVPFLVLGAVEALLLFGLVEFHRPEFQPLAVPLLRWVGGEGALHYPFALQALPVAFARLQIAIAVVFASGIGGVATLAFARAFGAHGDAAPWRDTGARYLPLVVYSLIAVAVVVLVAGLLPGLVPHQVQLENRMVRWGTRFGVLALTVILETVFAYGTAWIVLGGKGPLAAVAAACKTAARIPLASLAVIALPAILAYPLTYLEGRADVIVSRFRPELVIAVLATGIAARVLLGFLLAGSLTRLFLWREERAS